MSVRIAFRPVGSPILPSAFRLVLTDGQESYPHPARAAGFRTHYAKVAWAYGREAVEFDLPPGTWHWCASAGPEWTMTHGQACARDGEPQEIEVRFRRIFDRRAAGLVAADAHTHQWTGAPEAVFDVSLEAEAVDLAGCQCWGLYTGRENVGTPPQTGLFRSGGAWLTTDEEVEMHSPWGDWEDTTVVGLEERLPDLRQGFGYRMNAPFYRAARQRKARLIVYQSPTWAQFPVDAALGLVDGVNLCDNYFSVVRPERGPWEYMQFTQDDPLQREPFGIARWVFRCYYRMLNAGIGLPASGGSAFPGGGGGGPVGMNRFYIDSASTDPNAWIAAWRDGRTFATNGPILLASVNGRRPSRELLPCRDRSQLAMRVISNRPITHMEWVADGDVIARRDGDAAQVPCDLTWETEVDLRSYGWIAARVFGRSERSMTPAGAVSPPFLTAHTSPFYLPRFGQSSTARTGAVREMLAHLDWMEHVVRGEAPAPFATRPFRQGPLTDAEKADIFGILNEARTFWRKRMTQEGIHK